MSTPPGGGHSAWLESGAALAYSSTSQRFLVAWKSFPGLPAGAPIRLKVTLVNTSGARVSDVVNVSPEFGRDPGVAWDPTTNQFGVSFNGENGSGSVAYSAFADVDTDPEEERERWRIEQFYMEMRRHEQRKQEHHRREQLERMRRERGIGDRHALAVLSGAGWCRTSRP